MSQHAMLDEDVEIQHVIDRLEGQFSPLVDDAVIVETVEGCARRWVDAPIRVFVPLLTERYAAEQLRAIGSGPARRSVLA